MTGGPGLGNPAARRPSAYLYQFPLNIVRHGDNAVTTDEAAALKLAIDGVRSDVADLRGEVRGLREVVGESLQKQSEFVDEFDHAMISFDVVRKDLETCVGELRAVPPPPPPIPPPPTPVWPHVVRFVVPFVICAGLFMATNMRRPSARPAPAAEKNEKPKPVVVPDHAPAVREPNI